MAKQTYVIVVDAWRDRMKLEFKTFKESDKAWKGLRNYKTKALKHAYLDKLIKGGIAKRIS